MMSKYPDFLRCPCCHGSLAGKDGELQCPSCSLHYPWGDDQPIDLRLQRGVQRTITHRLPVSATATSQQTIAYGEMQANKNSRVDFSSIALPRHLTAEMASYIPASSSEHAKALDLGCGNGEYRRPLEHAGYQWVGCDFAHPNAQFLADAHSLPLADKSIDFVMSLAVLEHLRLPSVALREVLRVMKPGSFFLGSVTYLTPFHDAASYFNMTHAGVSTALEDAGFEVEFVYGERKYMGLHALSYAGLFLGAPRWLAYAIANPILVLSRLWWRYRRSKGMSRSSAEMDYEYRSLRLFSKAA